MAKLVKYFSLIIKSCIKSCKMFYKNTQWLPSSHLVARSLVQWVRAIVSITSASRLSTGAIAQVIDVGGSNHQSCLSDN